MGRTPPAVKGANQEERLWQNGNDPGEHRCRGLCLSPILLHVFFLFFLFPSTNKRDISPLPGPFSKGFPWTELPGEKSNLFWNKGKERPGRNVKRAVGVFLWLHQKTLLMKGHSVMPRIWMFEMNRCEHDEPLGPLKKTCSDVKARQKGNLGFYLYFYCPLMCSSWTRECRSVSFFFFFWRTSKTQKFPSDIHHMKMQKKQKKTTHIPAGDLNSSVQDHIKKI